MYVCCLSCFSLLFFFNIYIHSNASNIFCFFSSGICGRCIYSFALYTPFICLLLWTKNTREKKRKKKKVSNSLLLYARTAVECIALLMNWINQMAFCYGRHIKFTRTASFFPLRFHLH